MEGSRASGTPEERDEMVKATILRAAHESGAEAENMAVRWAAKIVVVELMQVGGMDAVRGELVGAVQNTEMAVLRCSRCNRCRSGSRGARWHQKQRRQQMRQRQ